MSKKRTEQHSPAEQPTATSSAPAAGLPQPDQPDAAPSAPLPPAGRGEATPLDPPSPTPSPQDQTSAAHLDQMSGDQAAQTPDAQPQPAPAEVSELSALRQQIAHLEAELDQARDRALRWQAELDNYRKRAARELENERRYAALPLMRDLLPVLDNIYRAVEAGRKASAADGLLEGFEMVAQQLEEVLRRHNCVRIEALHSPFDPNVHEAVLQQPSREHPPNTVLEVTQPGFQLHDRVVRPSRVVVSVPSQSE